MIKRIAMSLFMLFVCLFELNAQQFDLDFQPVNVTTTFPILSDMAKAVGGDRVKVYTLVEGDKTVANFQGGKLEHRKLIYSELIIINGLGFEPWVERMLKSPDVRARIIITTEDMPVKIHQGENINPYAWLHLQNALHYVKKIRDGLIAVDPKNRKIYELNASYYTQKIEKLMPEITQLFASQKLSSKVLYTNSVAFAYFTQNYNLSLTPPNENAAITSKTTRRFLESATQNTSPILIDKASPLIDLDQLQKKLPSTRLLTIYSENFAPNNEAPNTYLDLMKYNAQTILKALNEAK